MSRPRNWSELQRAIVRCDRCPRLREHCRRVATEKRRRFADWTYWGRPVPNFGDPDGRLLLVGLAPAAHGANRTGRMFTGDRSGDFLYRAMYNAGLASRPSARSADDRLVLTDIAITAVAHCAPPENKPTRDELEACSGHLDETVRLMSNLRGFVVLGGLAFDAMVRMYRRWGWPVPSPRPRFAHGRLHRFDRAPFLLASYHPSQQNTFTGRLTPPMLEAVFHDARRAADEA